MGTKKEAIYNLHLGKKMDTKKEALYKKVLKEVKAGATQREACKKFGVSPSTFSAWKGRQVTDPKVEREVEKKATTKKVVRKKQGEDDISVVVFKGDSKAIAKALKGVL